MLEKNIQCKYVILDGGNYSNNDVGDDDDNDSTNNNFYYSMSKKVKWESHVYFVLQVKGKCLSCASRISLLKI